MGLRHVLEASWNGSLRFPRVSDRMASGPGQAGSARLWLKFPRPVPGSFEWRPLPSGTLSRNGSHVWVGGFERPETLL